MGPPIITPHVDLTEEKLWNFDEELKEMVDKAFDKAMEAVRRSLKEFSKERQIIAAKKLEAEFEGLESEMGGTLTEMQSITVPIKDKIDGSIDNPGPGSTGILTPLVGLDERVKPTSGCHMSSSIGAQQYQLGDTLVQQPESYVPQLFDESPDYFKPLSQSLSTPAHIKVVDKLDSLMNRVEKPVNDKCEDSSKSKSVQPAKSALKMLGGSFERVQVDKALLSSSNIVLPAMLCKKDLKIYSQQLVKSDMFIGSKLHDNECDKVLIYKLHEDEHGKHRMKGRCKERDKTVKEPPDLKNWFSSYEYQFPALNTVDGLEGCDSLIVNDSEEEEVSFVEDRILEKDEGLGVFAGQEFSEDDWRSSDEVEGNGFSEEGSFVEDSFKEKTSISQTRKRDVKLEYAFPATANNSILVNSSHKGAVSFRFRAPNAYIVNATTVTSGIRCKCEDGFTGDGFTQGVGCLESCQDNGKETHGRGCDTKRRSARKLEVLAGIRTSAFCIASLMARCCLLKRHNRSGTFQPDHDHYESSISFGCRTRLFTYHELEEATKGFADCKKLVSSTSGELYTGVLANGLKVVVHKVQCGSKGDLIQVLSQVEVLSAVSHKNMACVLGCSIDCGDTPLVVYEDPANGMLLEYLHQNKQHNRNGLDWYTRLNIVTETASVLAFMQCEICPPIIHIDLQSGYILLDQEFSARIAGFGLQTGQTGSDHSIGSRGVNHFYRSDVYHFGLVLMSGRQLRHFDASGNNFTGHLMNLTAILDVPDVLFNFSGNHLYGNLTSSIGKFGLLDLSNNYLQGAAPNDSGSNIIISRNCFLSLPGQRSSEDCKMFFSHRGLYFNNYIGLHPVGPSLHGTPKRKHRLTYVLVGVFGGLGFIILLASVLVVLLKICSKRNLEQRGTANVSPAPEGGTIEPPKPSFTFCPGESFTYKQMLQATKDFSDTNFIKHGHSGDLFRGTLEGGFPVVIKRVDVRSFLKDSYTLELEFFNKFSHTRLVPLLGYCLEQEDEKFFVYKYMPNGDLSKCLYRPIGLKDASIQSLDWITRLKIAIGAAEGLCYLHHECNPSSMAIIVGSTLVLLDIDLQEIRGGKLEEIVDPVLYYHEQPTFVKEQIERVADLATRCLLFGADGKLSMMDAARELLHIRTTTGTGAGGGSSRRGPALEEDIQSFVSTKAKATEELREKLMKLKNQVWFWEDVESTHARFPLFHLEDKVNLWG